MKQLNTVVEETVNQETTVTEETVTLSTEEISKIVNNDAVSKSNRMVELYGKGLQIKQISELMGTRYNFVYNVVSNFTRVNNIELRTRGTGDSKKQLIIDQCKLGLSNTDISKNLSTNYNYVYKVVTEYLKTK